MGMQQQADNIHSFLSNTVFCHTNGVAHIVLILESALYFPPLLSPQTQTAHCSFLSFYIAGWDSIVCASSISLFLLKS